MKKGCLIAFGVILLCVSGIFYLLWEYARIKSWGVGVSRAEAEWIPENASDVTFISGDINKIAEFNIDQAHFEAWCESIGKPLSPVAEEKKARMWRANPFLERIGAIKERDHDDEYLTWRYKTFDKGDLFFEERWPNGGGYAIGYDVSAGRGYYEYAHH